MGILHNLTGWHALILLAVVLLFFGAAKLPALARSVGQSVKILKSEVRDGSAGPGNDDGTTPETDARRVATGPTPSHAVAAPTERPSVADVR